MTITGFNNRYSTSRAKGNGIPIDEIFFKTFDATGRYQIDFSSPVAFVDELVAGIASFATSSVSLSETLIGQRSSFMLDIEYPGLQTFAGDQLEIEIGQINGEYFSGQLFILQGTNQADVKVNG